ncbi:sigma-70 family RNA polymerase sigma factor [bacterium]|nr:sigma-70 family RNA polymerase sigma factor [bacterium]
MIARDSSSPTGQSIDMSGTRPADILRHLAGGDAEAPDRDLLRRYVSTRDHAAFAELVRRHGPVVLAACRRGTFRREDAEDSFQAVFLILARRAGSVGQPELLGNWLYRVAVRVARDARRAAARRRVREVQGVDAPEPVAPPTTTLHDLGPVLDQELEALPALYRDAVILCDLRGLSRADAAAQLAIPLGTLASRLDAARKKLAARLVRRGVTLSVGAVLVEARAVAVHDILANKTCGLVADWLAGVAVPAAVLRLSQGGGMMRSVVLGGVVALSLAAGVVIAAGSNNNPPPVEPPAVAVAAVPEAQPQPKRDAGAVRYGEPQLTRLADLNIGKARAAAWSRDGAWLAVRGTGGVNHLAVVPVSDPTLGPGESPLAEGTRMLGFAENSRDLLTVIHEVGLISGENSIRVWQVRNPAQPKDPGEFRGVSLSGVAPYPLEKTATEVAPGETGFQVHYLRPAAGKAGANRVEVRHLDLLKGEPRTVGTFEGKFLATRFTPGAKRVVVVTEGGGAECYAAEGGKRLWASGPPAGHASTGPPLIAIARDGSRVLAGRDSLAILDGETGKALPPLEGIDWVDWVAAAVSGDGRLAALSYTPLLRTGTKLGWCRF